MPDHTTLYRFFERLEKTVIEKVIEEILQRIGDSKRKPRKRVIAVEVTGLSTFYAGRVNIMEAVRCSGVTG